MLEQFGECLGGAELGHYLENGEYIELVWGHLMSFIATNVISSFAYFHVSYFFYHDLIF